VSIRERLRLLHRIMLPDGTTRQSKSLRWLRTVGYGLIGISGILLILSPIFPPDVGQPGIVMSWFLVVGGLMSSIGSATQRWVGEFTGLPLLIFAFLVFAILVAGDLQAAPYITGANMCLLVGFSTLMTARWRYVLAIFHIASRHHG
jgi:hypothetical protein